MVVVAGDAESGVAAGLAVGDGTLAELAGRGGGIQEVGTGKTTSAIVPFVACFAGFIEGGTGSALPLFNKMLISFALVAFILF